MKKTGTLLALLSCLLWILPIQAQKATVAPPTDLKYTRLWTDSIRLQWDRPAETPESKTTEIEWTELPLKHVATYRVSGSSRPFNPATDGEFIYMSSWSQTGASVFYKYDLYGTFIEQFTIDGIEKSLRDLAYDGTYFYGGYEGINKIAVLDLANHKLVGGIDVDFPVRHICYIPTLDNGKGGFEVGDFGTSYFIDKNGKTLKESAMAFDVAEDSTFTNSPNKQVYGTAYHNGKIYTHSQLGVMDFSVYPIDYDGPYSSVLEYDVNTGKPTGRRFVTAKQENKLELDAYLFAAGIEILEFPKGTFKILLGFQEPQKEKAPLVILDLESAPLPAGMTGYNLYADNVKVNASPIDKNAYTFDLGKVPEGQNVKYALKALYGSTESEAAELSLTLPDSRLLPFMEDFNSLSLTTNYWTIKDTARTESKPWRIASVASIAADQPNTVLLDYNAGAANLGYSATLESKKLNLSANRQVLVRFQTAQTVNWGNPPFCDTLFLEANTGNGWVEVARDVTVGNGKTLTYYTYDISDIAAGKTDVTFRFRVNGNSRTADNPYGYGYHFYVDNFKIWEPDYATVKGSVGFEGQSVENVSVTLRKHNDILVYSAKSDQDGAFSFTDPIEKGEYTLTAVRPDYNVYTATVNIEQATETLQIDLLRPAFSTLTDTLRIIMHPDEQLRSGFELTNSGSGPMTWNAAFEFPEENKTKDLEEYPVLASWKARGNVEKSFAYLNGTIYSYYTSAGQAILLKAQKDGIALEEQIPLPLAPYTYPGAIFADKSHLYFTIQKNICKYDLESNSFTDTIVMDVPYNIAYATWNPVSNTILAGCNNDPDIQEIDMEGNVIKTYSVEYPYPQYIAVDPSPQNGPVLWLTRKNSQPQGAILGEYLGVYEYSLDSAKLTGRYFVANKHPEYVAPVYTQRQTAEISGFFGSTEYFPGRFTLFCATSIVKQGQQDASLCAVYDVAQAVKWIGMETYKGELAAGQSSNFYLNFNTEDLKQGDRKSCFVTISADVDIDPLVFPVILEVDSTYENPCYTPSGITHRVQGSEYVELEWRVTTSGGGIVTEGLEGFLVRRNGLVLTDTLLKEASFRDTDPIMGTNIYEIQAFYKFPTYECNSPWSAPDTAKVIYDGECATVTNLTAAIANQRHVTLTWDYPVNDAGNGNFINESFETFEAFNKENIGGGWTSIDVDRAVTYGITDITFPHHGEALPFIVFNPSQTTPSYLHRVGAYSGMQMLASFSARLEGVRTNDWIISPEITDSTTAMNLYFMAKTAFLNYGYEEMKVAYSTTGKEISDFVYLNEGRTINVPGDWTEYSFKLPKGTKYVAINCVSLNKFMLLIDDIYVGPTRHHMRLENYVVYKNGELLQEITPRAFGFYDYALRDGEYTYTVAARYNNGCISENSAPAVADIQFKHGITPARGLTAAINEKAKSVDLSWKEPAWGNPEHVSYHNGMSYGFAISDFDGNKLPFYAAIKIDMNDPTLIDYSISALRIGFFDECEAEAVIIDMEEGAYVAKQDIPYINKGGFTTVSFDNPVKLELGKSYLVGYHVFDYADKTFPAGQDDGPLVQGYGDYLSIDGYAWSTVSAEYEGEILANWAMDVILEVTDKPETKGSVSDRGRILLSDLKKNAVSFERSQMKAPVVYRNIEPKNSEPEVAVKGYQVARNGMLMQKTPQQVFAFQDMEVRNNETYKYWILTSYENGQSVNSDTVEVIYLNRLDNESEMQYNFDIRTSDRHILIENAGDQAYDVEIRNIGGSLLQSRSSVTLDILDIPMNQVASGVYIVSIRQGKVILVKKVYL